MNLFIKKLKPFAIVALLLSFPVWFYVQHPVYDEASVAALIDYNIPVGTDMKDVMIFIDSLESKGVVNEYGMAYFPDTLYMRGWWYVRVIFEFKDGELAGYTMDRIKI